MTAPPAMSARDAPTGRLCPSCGGEVRTEGLTHCAAHVSEELGITYRQLDYWVRQGYLRPEPRTDPASGVNRTWPADELEIARRMAQLTRAGIAVECAAVFARESWPAGEIAPGVALAVTEDSRD